MPPGLLVTPELLARHADSLRTLARRLLADDDAAEDVLQETWLVALRRPPRCTAETAALRGWLATVVRSLAFKRLRGEARRSQRERTAARDSLRREPSGEGPAEALGAAERARVLREVTDAVLALEEPYRDTLLLRYFEDLPPREIARRQGVPVTTVKSRLTRAVQRLRSSLRRTSSERGDARDAWRDALAVLLGLPLAPPAPSPGPRIGSAPVGDATRAGLASVTGASLAGFPHALLALMNLKVAVPSLLALALCGAVAWQARGEDGAHVPTPPAARAVRLDAAQDAPPLPAAATSVAGRTALDPEPSEEEGTDGAAGPPQPAPFEFRLSGRVLDGLGLGIAGATIDAAPIGHELNRLGRTDEAGRFDLRWAATEAAAEVALQVSAEARETSAMFLLSMDAGSASEVEIGLAGGTPAVAPLVRAEGDRWAAIELPAPSSYLAPTFVSTQDLQREVPEAVRDAQGLLHLVGSPGTVACPGAVQVYEAVAGSYSLHIQPRVLAGDSIRALLSLAEAGALSDDTPWSAFLHQVPATARVEGRVLARTGEPVPGAFVCPLSGSGAALPGAWTGEDGSFVLEAVPAGDLTLRACSPAHGEATRTLVASAGTILRWEPELDPGLELRGRLRDAEGAGLAGWRVELGSPDPARVLRRATTSDENGRFLFTNAPDEGLRLLLWPPNEPPDALPTAVLGPVWPRSFGPDLAPESFEEHEVALQSRGSLAVAIERGDGQPLGGATVRLWHPASGRGRTLAPTGKDGGFLGEGIPAGEVRLEAGAPGGHGGINLGPLWIAAGERTDLGRVALADPALLELEPRGASEERPRGFTVEVWTDRAGVRSLSRTFSGMTLPALLLPQGRTIVAVRSGSRTTAVELPLSAGLGERLTVDLEDGLALTPAGPSTLAPAELWARRERRQAEDLPPLEELACHACHGTTGALGAR